MAQRSPPRRSCHVALAPTFDDGVLNSISITLYLTEPECPAGESLLTMCLNCGTTPMVRYDDDDLEASDQNGLLALSYEDTEALNSVRTWSATRDTIGEVIVRVTAWPRETDIHTPMGPRVDLRDDQGGAVGMGQGFIPLPPDRDEDWYIRISWDVPASVPDNVRFTCTLGDTQEIETVGRPSEHIGNGIFAVGPGLERYPPWDTLLRAHAKEGRQEFAMYWFGKPPWDMHELGGVTERIFRAIAGFFGDTTGTFRVFVRRVWTGDGGTGANRSFLLEYSHGTEEEQSLVDLIDILAHETVHAFPLLLPMETHKVWYDEGAANYYAAVAPFAQGAVDKAHFLRILNKHALAYYTSSTVHLPWAYITAHFGDTFALVKDGYGRGFMYLAKLQGILDAATDGQKSIDDLVLALYKRQMARVDLNSDDFHALLAEMFNSGSGAGQGHLRGQEVAEKLRASMEAGELIVPSADCFRKYGLRMVQQDSRRFEAGFNPNSLRANVRQIQDLVPGSRAQEAGLREGDKVVRSWMLWRAGDALENRMQVVVERDGGEEIIEYWPRSDYKVECWVWEEV